jgi:hypothetical protein
MMTSCGTGMRRPTVVGSRFRGLPPGVRGINALRAIIYDTQLQGVMVMQSISNPRKSWPINSEIGGMDGTCISGAPILDYQRMDVRLDRKPKPKKDAPNTDEPIEIERMIGREISWEACEGLDQLANGKPENMSLLLEIGECAGKTYVDAAYPDPKFDLIRWRSQAA